MSAEQQILLDQWNDTMRAHVGAFDTPIARRRLNDEFSADARKRMSEFDARLRAFLVGLGAKDAPPDSELVGTIFDLS